ncbi:MAG: transcription antitermination factor NusB [Saprospiraceae bacterium]
MLSRRNIRIKVMQVLYAMNRDQALTKTKALAYYHQNINQSYELFLLNLLQFIKVAEYTKIVKKKKLDKFRPTEEDLSFQPKLLENELISSLIKNLSLYKEFQNYKTGNLISEDNTRTFYKELSKTDQYQEYLKKNDLTIEDHRQILIHLYKTMLGNEVFEDVLDEKFLFWDDDKSLVIGAMKKTIKALPTTEDFFEAFKPTDETVVDFGEVLLNKVQSDGEELFNLIEPTLKNWDAERVAVIDMILLKMAVCELVSFPTIPTKVTLNEFVEISKLYSTDKSKDFINGILDRLLKKLEKEGKVLKEGRGLIQ